MFIKQSDYTIVCKIRIYLEYIYVIVTIFLHIGHEILPCGSQYTQELCQPCYDDPNTRGPDFVQPDYISSVDGDTAQLKCFKPLTINGKKRSCTGQG